MVDFIKFYPDGASYAKLPASTESHSFVFKLDSYERLWQLNQIVDAWNHYYGQAPTVTIPNLIDAQADRRFGEKQSSGLKLVCNFLNGMSAKFKIFHPHNPEVVEALMDNVEIITNSYFIKTVLTILHRDKHLNKNGTLKDTHFSGKASDHLALMSADAGGFKPLMKLCDKINWQGATFSASKSRLTGHSEDRMVQRVDREDFEGKDILIVDDICVHGGTFKGLSKLLRERNCGKLYLAVSHMTVEYLGGDSVTNYFDRVFTTNSKYDDYYKLDVLGIPERVSNEQLQILEIF